MNVTVSQLNAYVKQMLSMDVILNNIIVSGEISGLKMHSSGHIYFSLKDEGATIRCAFFKPHSLRVAFKPEDGMKVLAHGRVSLYERDGTYQLNVFELEQDGDGKLFKEFTLLKQKLEAEGLFDEAHKKSLPRFVKKIGVATSPTGAVFRDIINVSTRRCPGIQIVLAPVTVQGDDASRSICAGIKALEERDDVDVIIVGRGGGSMEDLWCFNDETLARTVFACKKPIISAVGHETDFTIIDFVADMRAPTPSAAAELAVFDYYDICADIDGYYKFLEQNVLSKLSQKRTRLYEMQEYFKDPEILIQNCEKHLEKFEMRLIENQNKKETEKENLLAVLSGKLNAMSPLKVLERGYSVVCDKNGKIIKKTGDARKGEEISLRVTDGIVKAEVK